MKLPTSASRPWLPYVAPMAAFLLLTSTEGWVSGGNFETNPTRYAVAYTVKIALVAAVVWVCRSTWRDLRPWPSATALILATLIGLGVAALWVGLDGLYPVFGATGTRAAFNPYSLPSKARLPFLIVRFFGLAVLVPLLEELFWRSFLMRWLIHPEFEKVPIGTVTVAAALISAAIFATAHPEEWLPALLTGLAWAWLLHRTRSVSACVVSHIAANLALGIYVLATGAWKFW